MNVNRWIPTVAVAAIADFAASFLPRPWAGCVFLGFSIFILATLAFLARDMSAENFRLLIYPDIAVSALYAARSFARGKS
jgi:hypothetical protein